MRVIGTAGHVDHGKSTLIAALTGTHPDRLKEEQAREMTIDLGFGWMTLPSGEEVGIVDVPGHRDFIENMLSGIGGIDAALLVIAADEGVMPQTREHLAILDLLRIPSGLIVLSKIDLAAEIAPGGSPAWLDLVESDVRAAVAGTVLAEAPIVRVSARTGAGLQALLEQLDRILEQKPPRKDLNRPRLPVDRVFSMSGFGTVVTGTLLDGHLALGDDVQILPSGQQGRVRGLQTHRKKEERAVPGSRTAVNISGVATDSIQRGDVVVRPNQYQATRRLDVHFQLLTEVSSSIKHNSEVKLFVGASETIATLRLLGTEELHPGEAGWLQLELRDPIVAVRGDRYIVRRPSPAETLGGGVIVDHQPRGRHRRFDEGLLRSLESLLQGSPADVLFEAAMALHVATAGEVIDRSRLEATRAQQALTDLLTSGAVLSLEASADPIVMAQPHWTALKQDIFQIVDSYHARFPLRRGLPREELKSRLKLDARAFNAVLHTLTSEDSLRESSGLISKAGHEVMFTAAQVETVRALMQKFEQNPYSPPGLRELQEVAGEEILTALLDSSNLIAVSPEVLFRHEEYGLMVARIRDEIREKGKISLAEVRDLFKTSRKYAQALLEHLDATGVTVRSGDVRILRQK